jgi:hypothetical protein
MHMGALPWAKSAKTRNREAHAANGNTPGSASASHPYAQAPAGRAALDPVALLTIMENRARALRRRLFCHRRAGLAIPMPPAVWDPPEPPARPAQPAGWQPPPIDAGLLREMHQHPRDLDVVFRAIDHKYFVRGVPTLGSVTGLIHRFARDFDADEIIYAMQRGSRWLVA